MSALTDARSFSSAQSIARRKKRCPHATFLPDWPADDAADVAATLSIAIAAGTPWAAAFAAAVDAVVEIAAARAAAATALVRTRDHSVRTRHAARVGWF